LQTWAKLPATLNSIELEEHDDGESVSYTLHGQFHYRIDDVEYSSDRISIDSAEGSLIWIRKTYRRLKPLIDHPNAITCFVHPSQPDQAILLRETGFQRSAFFSIGNIGFGWMGILGSLVMFRLWKHERETFRRKETHPNEPWKWNTFRNERKLDSAQGIKTPWLKFFVFWGLIGVLPATLLSLLEVLMGNAWGLSGLLPLGVELPLLYFAIRYIRLSGLMGNGELQMPKEFFHCGASTKATCIFATRLIPSGDVRANLTRTDTVYSGTDYERTIELDETYFISPKECKIKGGKLHIPVSIAIPADAPCSSEHEKDGSIWMLDLAVPTGSGKLKVRFELPVFETEKRKPA